MPERERSTGWPARPAWNLNLAASTAALMAAVQCNATYQTWTDAPAANENRPMVCVSWFEAMAFCAWDGGFFPTEAESMYAASGGVLQRAFPWSNPPGSTTVDCTTAAYGGASWPATACTATGSSDVGSTSPRGDGVWGQADLGGNVWEWLLDWNGGFPNPCTDCANLVAGMYRGLRGGSFTNTSAEMRSANRELVSPSYRAFDVGVRCARRP